METPPTLKRENQEPPKAPKKAKKDPHYKESHSHQWFLEIKMQASVFEEEQQQKEKDKAAAKAAAKDSDKDSDKENVKPDDEPTQELYDDESDEEDLEEDNAFCIIHGEPFHALEFIDCTAISHEGERVEGNICGICLESEGSDYPEFCCNARSCNLGYHVHCRVPPIKDSPANP